MRGISGRLGMLGLLAGLLAWGPVGGSTGATVLDTDRLWTIGASAFEDGLFDQAYRALGQFIALGGDDPRRGDAGVLRGKAALALGQLPEALAEFQAAERFPTRIIPTGEPLFWQAEVLFRLDRFEEARDLYGRFLAVAPGSSYAPDALYGKGQSELHVEAPVAAINSFTTLVERFPQSKVAASAAYSAALELVRAKRWDEALGLLEPYASRYPSSPVLTEARYLLGVTLVEKGRTAEGVRAIEGFLVAAPKHDLAPAARAVLADTYEKTGRPRDAIAQYQLLVKQAAARDLVPRALYQIGELNRRLGRVAETEAAWRTLRREFPQDPYAGLAGVGLVELDLGRKQFERAAALAREVAGAGGPRRFDALLAVGESTAAGANLKEAETAYAQVLAEAPAASAEAQRAAAGLLLIGERVFKAGRLDDAARVYGRVREATTAGSPEQFRALAGLGLVAEARGAADDARRTYTEIVRGAGDRELVRWAETRLQGLEAAGPKTPPAVGATPGEPAPAGEAPASKEGS